MQLYEIIVAPPHYTHQGGVVNRPAHHLVGSVAVGQIGLELNLLAEKERKGEVRRDIVRAKAIILRKMHSKRGRRAKGNQKLTSLPTYALLL